MVGLATLIKGVIESNKRLIDRLFVVRLVASLVATEKEVARSAVYWSAHSLTPPPTMEKENVEWRNTPER